MADLLRLDDRWPDATRGEHVVYHLCGEAPGLDPEESVTHIYIGVTSNLPRRIDEHERQRWWFPLVRPELSEFVLLPTRAGANDLEREMIHWYQPAMNRAGRLLVLS